MIPQPIVTDRVSQIVLYLLERSNMFAGEGAFSDEFGDNFEHIEPLNEPLVGAIMRGWNGGPFALVHRTGGQVLTSGVLEAVDIQIDAYGPTGDDAFDVAAFIRESLAVAPIHLDECVLAEEVVGPMMLPDLEGSLDAYRYLLQWRLRFRI